MDYFTLNRRELQALCKKHAIPANLTNVSMAEALTALLNVDDNKGSDDGFQKQQATSELEDTGDKSVLTDISNTPRKCTKSKRHEVSTEGKSAEEPIVLDDDEAPSALKEKHMKSATKTLKGKGGDQTEKSRSKIRQRKILDKDVDESSDAVTLYNSVKVQRGRTCKRGTESIQVSTHMEDAKSQKQEHDSYEKEKESEEANNGSVTEVPKARPKGGLSRKKVDKAELATEERIQESTHTEDAKPLQQEHDSCEKEKGSDEANNGSVKEVPKAGPKGKLPRKKVDKVEMATEESNQVSTHTEDAKPLQQESCEQEEGSDEANNGSLEEAPKTRARRRLLRKKVEKGEMDTEERIQESVDANVQSVEVVLKTRPKTRPSRNRVDKLEEATKESIQGTNNANDRSVKEVHETRHNSIRQKFDVVKEAAEDNIDGSVDAKHNAEEDTKESTGTDDANDESVKEVSDISFKGRSSRKKVDEVKEAAEECKGTDDSYNDSVKEVPENMPKGKSSKKKAEEATKESIKWTDDVNDEEISRTRGVSSTRKRSEEVAEEKIQGVDDESKGDQNPICRRSTRANALKGLDTQPLIIRSLSRRKYSGVDSVKETPGASKRIKNSSDKKVEYDPAETSVKVSAKKHVKTPVHTWRALSTKKDSPKFLDGDAMEESARKVNKQVSICTRTNQIQNSYDSADVKNGGESISDLDCSEIKQGRVGHRRTTKKATIKSHHKDLDLADLAAKGNTEAFEGKLSERVEGPKGIDSEEVMCEVLEQQVLKTCQNSEEQMPSNLSQAQSEKQIQNKSIVEMPSNKSSEILKSPTAGKVNEMNVFTRHRTIEKQNTDLKEAAKMSTGLVPTDGIMVSTEQSVKVEAQQLSFLKSQDDRMPAEVSAMKKCVFRSSTDTGEVEAPGIEDKESWEKKAVVEGANSVTEPENVHEDLKVDEIAGFSCCIYSRDIELEERFGAPEGEAHCIEDEKSCGKAVEEGTNVAGNHSGAEPRTIHEGLVVDEKTVFSHGMDLGDIEKCHIDAQESEAHSIEDENCEKAVQKSMSSGPKPETKHNNLEVDENAAFPRGIDSRDAGRGEALCIEVEEIQGKTVQSGAVIAGPGRIEPQNMHLFSNAADNATFPYGIKSKFLSQGESMQEGVSIAESPNVTEPEPMCSQESETPGFKDEEDHSESMKEGVSISESSNGTDPESICAQEGEIPGIKDEEREGESMQEGVSIAESSNGTKPETMCAQEGEARGIKDEVSLQEGLGKAESPDGTKPETMCAQEGEAPGIKDEVIQGESMLEGVSRAEMPNGTKPETMCAQEGKAPGIKDEEKTVSIADSNNETETENMHSPGGGEASGTKDETNLLKTIQEGIRITESHNQTEPETMHLDPKVGAKPVFYYGMDSTCIEQSNEILKQNDYELDNFNDTIQLNCSRELSASSAGPVEDSMLVLDREPEASWKETTPNMMVVQEIVIGEPGTVAGPTEKDCLHTEVVGSDDLKYVVGKPTELQQCTANDETIDNIVEGKPQVFFNSLFFIEDVHKEIRSDIASTTEDPGAKNSEDLVLSVTPNILELQKREGTSFANVEGQDKDVPGEVHNNELCSDEVHISFREIKQQSLLQSISVKIEDGTTEGKVQFYSTSSYSNDKSFEEVPTGLEDDDIQARFSDNVSEAVTSVSIGNDKADLVERLASLSVYNDNQTDVRVTSSPVQVDNEDKAEKTMASSSAQIDSEDQIKKFTSELVDGKKELYSACICTVAERIKDSTSHEETGSNKFPLTKEHFVPDTVKNEKLHNNGTGSREEFVPSTPPKEEQHILIPIDDEQESSHVNVKLEILALGNTDEESEVIDSQEAFKTSSEVEDLGLGNTDEDLGLGNKNPLALQDYKQHYTKECEETLCQAKAPPQMAETHFHEKFCGLDEQVQVTYKDKLQNEANNNVLLIEKNSPSLTGLSLCKLRAMCKDKMAKTPVSMKNTRFQEKTCSKDEVTCGNKLQNEVKKENCDYNDLSLRKLKALYKEKKAKRSALQNLSSNDLEEREKGPNKAEL